MRNFKRGDKVVVQLPSGKAQAIITYIGKSYTVELLEDCKPYEKGSRVSVEKYELASLTERKT